MSSKLTYTKIPGINETEPVDSKDRCFIPDKYSIDSCAFRKCQIHFKHKSRGTCKNSNKRKGAGSLQEQVKEYIPEMSIFAKYRGSLELVGSMEGMIGWKSLRVMI